jgi:Ribbon-helix-helix protein, copG family
MRTIIDLPDDQVAALDALCRRDDISRAEAVRRAVARHVQAERAADPDRAFGLWRKRPVDSLKYQRRLRGEWSGRDA